jgi:hypothetical protein
VAIDLFCGYTRISHCTIECHYVLLSSSPRPPSDPPSCFLSFARCDTMADSSLPSPLNCISSLSVVHSSDTIRLDMKDVTSNRHSRNSLIYPKKRPSPHGISKSHKSPLLPANGLARRTPRSTKVALIQQKQREAQIQALRREGIFLEEEYREEIRYYMQDMEVSSVSHFFSTLLFKSIPCPSSALPRRLPSQWINSLRLDGTCAPALSIF